MEGQINIHSNEAQPGSTQIINVQQKSSRTKDEINQACLRALRHHDPFEVKIRLQENKDKLIEQCFEWILRTAEYVKWQDSKDVGLLWIKGGAGKGKTMLSIGLIEKLSQIFRDAGVVTYFFCQNADTNLNSVEAILKGLILQLVRQQDPLKSILRDCWDAKKESFTEDLDDWRGLWTTFMKMLDLCDRSKLVFIVVDALDECRDENLAPLLKLVVCTGLFNRSRVKWILTSRPLDNAGRELLTDSDQELVSLDLNDEHISRGVAIYISHKVTELNRRWGSRLTDLQDIETKLIRKADGTMLWVSLVCKRLEKVPIKDAIAVIDDLPPDLYNLYDRAYRELCCNESQTSKQCARLLQVMMLAFRPLHMQELPSITGLGLDKWEVEALIEQSTSFVKTRGDFVEFIHESTRDYLADLDDRPLVAPKNRIDHGHIASNCLSYLIQYLGTNLLNLPQSIGIEEVLARSSNDLLVRSQYAAVFWPRHLEVADETTDLPRILVRDGLLDRFFKTRIPEWLECLGLSDHLSSAVQALETVSSMLSSRKLSPQPFSVVIAQDARLFVLRHFHAISTIPLQSYASTVVFSPRKSIVRQAYLDRIPPWLTSLSTTEENWSSLSLKIGANSVIASSMAFSPDGRQIASSSQDKSIKLWDSFTGKLQQTIAAGLGDPKILTYSPDGQCITLACSNAIKVWDLAKGIVRLSLDDELPNLVGAAPSQGSQLIAAMFANSLIESEDKLWKVKVLDTTTGETISTFTGINGRTDARISPPIAYSANAQRIAWIACNRRQDALERIEWDSLRDASEMIEIRDAMTGEICQVISKYSVRTPVHALAFSPIRSEIASNNSMKLSVWGTSNGLSQLDSGGHPHESICLTYSSDGHLIASGSLYNDIKIWDGTTGKIQSTLIGHTKRVISVAFSPDGRRVASGSEDCTLRIWNVVKGGNEGSPGTLSGGIAALALSATGQRAVSVSGNDIIKIWDTASGKVDFTLRGFPCNWKLAIVSPDGRHFASGGDSSSSYVYYHCTEVRIWDMSLKRVKMDLPTLKRITIMAYSSNGQYLALGSCSDPNVDKGRIQINWKRKPLMIEVWDVETAKLRQTLVCRSSPASDKTDSHEHRITAIAFSHDLRRLAAATSHSHSAHNTVEVWDLVQPLLRTIGIGEIVRKFHISKPSQSMTMECKPITMLRFSSDDSHLITNRGIIRVVHTANLQLSPVSEASPYIYLRDQCLYYGNRILLMLPASSEMTCYDVREENVAIGFASGQMVMFRIDTKKLQDLPDSGIRSVT